MLNHIYIHWPFCKKKCWYCDFASFAQKEDLMLAYHNALCNEITYYAQQQPTQSEIKTLFFGGGTPSLYPLDLLQNLFSVLRKNFSLDTLVEATIEVNPGTVTKKHLEIWKELGINRLSIGVQLLDETILKNVNRDQTNRSVINLLDVAPTYFDNISVDLILGLPGSTTDIWFETLTYLTNQPISHISIYFLMIHESTPLHTKITKKKISLPDEEWLIETYEKTIDFLERKNFLQYEISNFARPGRESIHNQAYWDHRPYRGFGLSASSFTGYCLEKNPEAFWGKRICNTKNLKNYIDCWSYLKLSPPLDRCFTQETLTLENVILEELMLGLRQKKGLDLQRMVYSLKECLQKWAKSTWNKKAMTSKKDENTIIREGLTFLQSITLKEKVLTLQKRGLLREKNGRVYLTTRGMVLENEVILKLL